MLKLKYSLLALVVVMMIGFVLSGNAHANPVCGTLEECRSLRTYLQFQLTQVDARIEEFLICQQPGGKTRTTTTGAVFTRDRCYAALNEAWRDPDGVIWGDTAKKTDGTVHYMVHSEATSYCTSIGARLPSKEEFTRLREYMGARSGTHEGYSHHDDKILPNLSDNWFWSSSSSPDNIYLAYGFSGSNGDIYNDINIHNNGAVRCVVAR